MCIRDRDETSILFQEFTSNQNTTLQTLNVSDNHYSTKHLEEMLSSNTSIQCVEITVTPVGQVNDMLLTMPYSSTSESDEDKPVSYDTFYSRLVMLAYFDVSNTLDSLCQVIVSAVNKSTTLQHLIIHTLFKRLLKSNLTQHQDYDKVKDRIQIVQSNIPIIE